MHMPEDQGDGEEQGEGNPVEELPGNDAVEELPGGGGLLLPQLLGRGALQVPMQVAVGVHKALCKEGHQHLEFTIIWC